MEYEIPWQTAFTRVYETLFIAVQYAYAADVAGDVVEFGTMTGNSAVALAQGIAAFDQRFAELFSPKRLWLFDSFSGLPKSVRAEDTESPHVSKGVWREGGCIDLDLDGLRQRVGAFLRPEQFNIIPGWFSDTVEGAITDARFSVIHVDCDLYQSTLDCLLPLFDRSAIESGAMILFDDWNCNRASWEYGERAAWRDLVERYHIQYSDEGGYGWAGHKFIVHGYRR